MKDIDIVALKELDGWKEVFIIDPITLPISKILIKIFKHPYLPIALTLISFILKIFAAFSIFLKKFIFSVIFYFISDIFDGMDGKVARILKNDNITRLHSNLDIICDTIGNTFIIIMLFLAFPEFNFYFLSYLTLLYIYEVFYAIRMETRLKKNIKVISMNTTINYYIKIISKHKSLYPFLNLYKKALNKTKKIRTYPNPTLVDSEFVLFIFFPIFQNSFILLLSILFLIPDIILSTTITLIITLKSN